MASIAGHEQEQQGRGQMKRKQVTAIITAAILAVSACMPVSSISAMAAEAGAEAEAAVEEDEAGEAKAAINEAEAAEETTTAIESEEPDEAEAAEASSNEAATEETSNAAATEASTEEVTTESSAEDAAEEAATEANPEDTAEEATAEEAAAEATSEVVEAEEASAEGDEENQLEDFSIALNATELELHVGETFQLELTVNDGQNDGTEGSGRNYEVGWRYDDTYLLDAYDGLVVAKHAGTEVVTAVVTVYEGWEKYIYRASCTVTIPYTTEGQCGENLYFDVSEAGVLTISGTGAMYDYTDGSETNPFIDCRFNSIVIEEGVTSVCSLAFSFHDELNRVTFYPGLESVGGSCFEDCLNLADVYFQGKITEWRDCYREFAVFDYDSGKPVDTVFHVLTRMVQLNSFSLV